MSTRAFKDMAKIYKLFVEEQEHLDFSDEALEQMFEFESKGKGSLSIDTQHLNYLKTGDKINGYSVGRNVLDITVAMWLDSLTEPGWLPKMEEIYRGKFPYWWLDSVFKNFVKQKDNEYKELGLWGELSPSYNIDKMKKRITKED